MLSSSMDPMHANYHTAVTGDHYLENDLPLEVRSIPGTYLEKQPPRHLDRVGDLGNDCSQYKSAVKLGSVFLISRCYRLWVPYNPVSARKSNANQ